MGAWKRACGSRYEHSGRHPLALPWRAGGAGGPLHPFPCRNAGLPREGRARPEQLRRLRLLSERGRPAMRRAFVIILDGLRRDFVSPERTPCLSEFATVAACFEAHRSVFPSATRAVSAA